jgi:hypothetical protein
MQLCKTIDLGCLNAYSGLIQAAIYLIQTLVLIAGFFIAWQQLRGLRRTTQGANILEFVHGHREIMRIAMEKPFLLTTLTWRRLADSGTKPTFDALLKAAGLQPSEIAIAEMFHSMLINHMATAYTQYNLRNVSKESWAGYEPDIRDYFSHDVPRARWRDVAKYQPPAFRVFVNAKIPAEEQPKEMA